MLTLHHFPDAIRSCLNWYLSYSIMATLDNQKHILIHLYYIYLEDYVNIVIHQNHNQPVYCSHARKDVLRTDLYVLFEDF
jgi:hypothetical protein